MDSLADEIRQRVQRINRTAQFDLPLNVRGERLRQEVDRITRDIQRRTRELPLDPVLRQNAERDLINQIRQLEERVNRERRRSRSDSGGSWFGDDDDDGGNSRWRSRFQALNRVRKMITPKFGTGFNPAAWALIIGSLLFTIAPLLGLLTAALMTLPGLIAAVATPVGALLLGFEGLKNAASNLKAPFESLQKTMSAKVQEQFTPLFKQMEKVFPMLKQHLPRVTQGIADFAKGAVDAVTSKDGMQKIQNIIDNIGKALSNMRPGVEAFTNGLLTLAENFTSHLPEGFADWFNNAGESFMKWVDEMDKDGRLDQIFKGLGDTLKTIAEGLGDIGDKALEFLEDPEKIQGFVDALKDLLTVLEGIVALSGQLGAVFESWSFLTGRKKNEDGSSMNPIERIAKANIASFGMYGLSEEQIEYGLKLYDYFQQKVLNGFETIKVAAQVAWTLVTTQISQAWESATSAVSNAWNSITSAISNGVGSAVNAVQSFGSRILSSIQSGFSAIPGAVAAAWDGVVSAVQEGVSRAVEAAANLRDQILGFFAGAAGWLVASGQALVQGFINGIRSMIGSAVGAVSDLVSSVRNLLPFSPAKEGPLSGRGYTTYSGRALARDFGEGIRDESGSAVAATDDMIQGVKDQFARDRGWNPDGWLLGDKTEDLKRAKSIKELRAVPSTRELERQEKFLDLQMKELDLAISEARLEEKKAVGDAAKEAAKARAEALELRKDELDIQKKQLDLVKEETEAQRELNRTYGELFGKALGVPVDFAEAAGNQFFSDLGFSNTGLAPTLLTEGTKYVFNISNVDEALEIKRREMNKQRLQYSRR